MPAGFIRAITALALLIAAAANAADADRSGRTIRQIEQLIGSQPGLRVYDWVGFSLRAKAVVLEGSVTRPRLRSSIERSVRALEAVETVDNRIEILPSSGDDIGVRLNAYWRIYGHPEIRSYIDTRSAFRPRLRRAAGDVQRVLLQPIHIVVRDGEITLEGELEQKRERRVAENQAMAVLGVRSVTNNIVVTGTDTEELEPIDFESDPWWVDSQSVSEPVLRVENEFGSVAVQVVDTERVRIRRTSRSRAIQPHDTKTTRLGRKMRVRAQPSDGAAIDLSIDLPYGHRLEVETVEGAIRLNGLVRSASLETETGSVELAVPWRAVRLNAVSRHRPEDVKVDARLRGWLHESGMPPVSTDWTLHDRRNDHEQLYGAVRLDAVFPSSMIVRDSKLDASAPVRMHWQAPEALGAMLRRPYRMRLTTLGGESSKPALNDTAEDEGVPQFNSEVRLVQLSATVLDQEGRPLTDLDEDAFEVFEDGEAQKLNMIQSTDAAFNLVLLLDCSTSTLIDREAVLEAARGFVMTARPADRVGIYVLSDAYLHVVSHLTDDRDQLLSTIKQIPRLSGGTPLYDAITLSYAHELAGRRWERNALIVISDGMDNDLLPRWSRSVPSEVPYDDLLRVAAEINSAIYPIFLETEEPGVRTSRVWRERLRQSANDARQRMRKLAETTGGRLFSADSIRDLDAVYEQVAEELRSVYTLAYYPTNQDFDGAWRRIKVNLREGGARIRTRPGYYGW